MKAQNVLQTIGNTPHIRINKLFGANANVWIKSERSNPGGSIKDRIALAMVEDAEKSGVLQPGGTIIEPTSGNTGVGLAMVAAVKGYKLILVMPDSMSIERRRLMLAYGATFDLTPREKGMKGAIARAEDDRREPAGHDTRVEFLAEQLVGTVQPRPHRDPRAHRSRPQARRAGPSSRARALAGLDPGPSRRLH
jgi:cysteine synthase A